MTPSGPELAPLRDSLATLDIFNRGEDERRSLLLYAGLDRFVPGLNFSTSASAFAGQLLLKLAAFGPLKERPGSQALGVLLCYLLQLSDLPHETGRLCAEFVVRFGLIEDGARIEELRREYDLEVAPPRPPRMPAMAGATPDLAPDFAPRVADGAALEDIIHSEDNFLDMALLVGALYCSRAVCRLEAPEGSPLGSGVLIGPDLLLTNQHVLPSQAMLEGAVARFGYRILDGTGVAEPGKTEPLRNDFYFASPPEALDYAIVRLTQEPLRDLAAKGDAARLPLTQLSALGLHRGFLPLVSRFLKERDRVNILQHPDARPLKVVLTQNYVAADMSGTRVQYVADTMAGSSGSPVFNSNWELVALHHSGQPYPPDDLAAAAHKIWKRRFRVNEGIPARAILADLSSRGLLGNLPGV